MTTPSALSSTRREPVAQAMAWGHDGGALVGMPERRLGIDIATLIRKLGAD